MPDFLSLFRCSSLDDLTWVTSAAEMSRSLQQNNQNSIQLGGANGRVGFHSNNKNGYHQRSNTLPNSGQISKMSHQNGGGKN